MELPSETSILGVDCSGHSGLGVSVVRLDDFPGPSFVFALECIHDV
jgi:hypothetical protein